NIGGGSRVSVNDVFRLIEQIVGCPVSIDRQAAQPGDMRDTFADTSLARAELGFEPKTSLAEGLAAEYDWLKPHPPHHPLMLVLLSPVRAPVQPRLLGVSALALLLLAGACAEKGTKIPAGTDKPDEFLFGRGNTALQEKRWFTAREVFQTLIDTYPQSQHRADAKLGLADAYLGDGSPASQVLAINEYREFLSFFPTSPPPAYAPDKVGRS